MDRDDVPYAMQVSTGPIENATLRDEVDFSTLQRVERILSEAISDLHSINAFSIVEDGGLTIKEQIAAYQKAYDILVPTRDMVINAIANVNEKHRG